MGKKHINCWEYKKCGREVGGKNVDALGVCPATSEEKYHEINKGVNGGRFCWLVEDTLCNGKVQSAFLDKFEECLKCKFYLLVQKQENKNVEIERVENAETVNHITARQQNIKTSLTLKFDKVSSLIQNIFLP